MIGGQYPILSEKALKIQQISKTYWCENGFWIFDNGGNENKCQVPIKLKCDLRCALVETRPYIKKLKLSNISSLIDLHYIIIKNKKSKKQSTSLIDLILFIFRNLKKNKSKN